MSALAISYCYGRSSTDSYPTAHTAIDFEVFADQILALPRARSRESRTYICGPMRPNGDGRTHRGKTDLLPRGWLALDLDGGSREGCDLMLLRLTDYMAVAWTTARSTAECPRIRILVALDRLVDGPEGERLGSVFVGMVGAGLDSLRWDNSTHKGEQECFLPMANADIMRYHGDPVDVDEVLATAPPAEPACERPTTADPYRALIIERGLLLREIGPGKDAITCPFASEHSEDTADTATVYLWPLHGGYKWGRIKCLHAHCADRKQEDYIRALDLEPQDVWRGQGRLGEPGTVGAKPTGGGEPRSGNGAAPGEFHGPGEVQIEAPSPWPILPDAALFGIFKEIVVVSTKSSEADPAAVLVTALTYAAAFIGTGPFTWVGDTTHHARFYSVLVGASSRSRKGTSYDPVSRIFREAERSIHGRAHKPFPLGLKFTATPGPLSSGEGLVYAVRDASEETDKEGNPVDKGNPDKRLFVANGEFGAALRAAQRDGNTLSAILRSGWDNGNIAPLTKGNRIKATGAHINFVAHITLEELHKLLGTVDLWNGFANRILWVCVRRSGRTPRPLPIPKASLDRISGRLAAVLLEAAVCGEMDFSPEAALLWDALYPELTEDHGGAFGAVTSRAEAQVRRLALLYAVLDEDASAIGVFHLRAAIALWQYCRDSARYIFRHKGRMVLTV